jgi:hypothetical protein
MSKVVLMKIVSQETFNNDSSEKSLSRPKVQLFFSIGIFS